MVSAIVGRNAVKQACDRCYRLKTRCIPETDSSCVRCRKSDSTCTYYNIHKKSGRKRKVISKLCEEEGNTSPELPKELYPDSRSLLLQHVSATGSFPEKQSIESLLQDAFPGLGTFETPATVDEKRVPDTTALGIPLTFQVQSPSRTFAVKTITSTYAELEGGSPEAETTPETNDFIACICANTLAPVYHTMCVLEVPVHISEFEAAASVKIYLPVLSHSGTRLISLLDTTEYLTAFAYSASSSYSIQVECQELLYIFARIAKEVLPMVRDERTKRFLVLLSCLGQQVSLKCGIWVELCGLGSEKAVIRHQGHVQMTNVDNVAKIS